MLKTNIDLIINEIVLNFWINYLILKSISIQ